MKCKHCHGTGKRFVSTNKNAITGNGYTADCLFCNGTGEIEVTNEENIRTCSTEELVNIIVCELRNADLHNMRLKYNLFNGNDFDVVRVWLKEKHHDK